MSLTTTTAVTPLTTLAAELVATTRSLRAALLDEGAPAAELAAVLPYLAEAAMDLGAMIRAVGDAARVRSHDFGEHAWEAVYEAAYDDAADPIGKGALAVQDVIEAVENATGQLLPPVDAAERVDVFQVLATARTYGLSLDTAILAALIAVRHRTPLAEAIDLARNDAFDPRSEDAGNERERLVEQATLARIAADYDETPAAVAR